MTEALEIEVGIEVGKDPRLDRFPRTAATFSRRSL
jgi:hypothetical protein